MFWSIYLVMRAYRRLHSRWPTRHRDKVAVLLRGGLHPVRVVLRALALAQLHAAKAVAAVAAHVRLTAKAVRPIGRRYADQGLDRARHDKPPPGATATFAASPQPRIMAMVCSDPPAGCARWSVRLVAAAAVTRTRVANLGRESIRRWLRHHHFKPWRDKHVVRGGTGS